MSGYQRLNEEPPPPQYAPQYGQQPQHYPPPPQYSVPQGFQPQPQAYPPQHHHDHHQHQPPHDHHHHHHAAPPPAPVIIHTQSSGTNHALWCLVTVLTGGLALPCWLCACCADGC